jgi:hypothetical protein
MDRLASGVDQIRIGFAGKNSNLSASETSQFGKTRAKDLTRFADETIHRNTLPQHTPSNAKVLPQVVTRE